MSTEKEIWLNDAKHKLTLLLEFDGHLLVPDAKTLNAFLLKPTLILKMMYKDDPEMLSEALIKYQDMSSNKEISPDMSKETIKDLDEAFVKGLTPNQAAIEQIKWCDTPDEAGKFIVSPEMNILPMMMLMFLFFFLTTITLMSYGMLRDKLAVQHESEHISMLYKNITNVYNQKGAFKLDNTTAIREGLVPERMRISDQVIIHNRWDGDVLIAGTSINDFEVKYTHVAGGEMCFNLLKKEQNVGWGAIVVEDNKLDNYKNIKNLEIEKQCASNDFVDITFKK